MTVKTGRPLKEGNEDGPAKVRSFRITGEKFRMMDEIARQLDTTWTQVVETGIELLYKKITKEKE